MLAVLRHNNIHNQNNTSLFSIKKKVNASYTFGSKYNIALIDHLTSNGKPSSHAYMMQKVLKILIPKEKIGNLEFLGLKKPKMKDITDNFKKINQKANLNDTFIALPSGAFLNIEELSKLMQETDRIKNDITPTNIDKNKPSILKLLKDIHRRPQKYKKEVRVLSQYTPDPENLYPLIKEINTSVKKGAKVKIIAGNAHSHEFRAISKQKGIAPELYHFLHNGEDHNNKISNLRKYLNSLDSGWNEFNLLSVSNADIVSTLDAKGNKYIFSNDNSLVKQWARGCYNICPVKDNSHKVIGYSLEGENKVNLTPEEFWVEKNNSFWGIKRPYNLEVFLGENSNKVVAKRRSHRKLKKILKSGAKLTARQKKFLNKTSSKIFEIKRIFTPTEIYEQKLNLKGRYVNNRLKDFYDINPQGKIVNKKFSVDRTQRPSVFPFNGSCFAVVRSVSDDIARQTNKTLNTKA